MPGDEFAIRCGPGWRGIFASRKRLRKFDAAAVVNGEDLGEDVIQTLNERRSSAKVGSEMHGIEAQRRFIGNIKADILYARKKFGVGIPKEINGLHRVANHKASTAFGLWPRGDEAAE